MLVSHIILLLILCLLQNRVTTTGSLAFTNFTSLEIFTAELLSPVYPNPVLLKEVLERIMCVIIADYKGTPDQIVIS